MDSDKANVEIGDVNEGIKNSNIAGGDVNIGLGVDELVNALKEALGKNDPRPEQVRQQLEEINQIHSHLLEWKILHNYMNDLLTQFGQFGYPVINIYEKTNADSIKKLEPQIQSSIGEDDVYAIKKYWRPLKRITNSLLSWIPETQQIGVSGLSKEIDHIREAMDIQLREFKVNRNVDQNKKWAEGLMDLTNEFEDFILVKMELSDRKLRETAEQLTKTLFRS